MTAEPAVILCAVDFSADSEAALLWAGRQAERERARLVVLHVVHDPAASPGFYRKPDGDWLRPMEDVAEEMFASFLTEVRGRHPEAPGLEGIQTMLVTGLPAGRVAEISRDVGADLIVVGSRGRTGLPHVLLGSVAERIVQIAHAPVTVVKAVREAQA